jgi:hypothetical protein
VRSKSLSYALVFVLAVVAVVFVFSRWGARSLASSEDAAALKQPVIVELFTSEGCSSCPPADELLKKLSEDQPFGNVEILALEEHVDYWNSLGWSDPYSSADFSRRQEQYAVTLPDGGVYTPQMIVDGATQFIGNRTHEAREQIRWAAAHPKAQLLLTAVASHGDANSQTRTFELRVAPGPGAADRPETLWIAVTEKNLTSKVTAGENSGELLHHAPVVRLLRQEKSAAGSAPVVITVDVKEKWNSANLTLIAFEADAKSHQIVAAGAVAF